MWTWGFESKKNRERKNSLFRGMSEVIREIYKRKRRD
jgi:hypothetical protein